MSDTRVPWIKVWGEYTTTPSHADLDDRNLWTGVALMQLIRAGCDARGDRQTWALRESGDPCTVAGIARHARQPVSIAKAGLELLVKAGTVVLREDGAYGMPKFWKKQESRWAEGKRGKAMGKVTNESPSRSPVSLAKSSDSSLRSETDSSLRSEQIPPTPSKKTASRKSAPTPVGTSVADVLPTASAVAELPANDMPGEESPAMLAATSKPRRRGKPRVAVLDEDFAQAAYAAFSQARAELTGRTPQGLTATMRDELSKLVAACNPTAEDWRMAVQRRLAMDRAGAGYGSLTWASLTVPANFERWLLEAQKPSDMRSKATGRAPVSSRPTQSGVVDLQALFGKREPT